MMERAYTYTAGLFPGEAGIGMEKFVYSILIALALVLLAKSAAKFISTAEACKSVIVPRKFSSFALLDFIMEKLINFQDGILGKHNRRYASLTFSVFIFILACNLFGLIPGMPAVTTCVWVNVGMALTVFIAFNYYGIKTNGIKNYLAHFCGGPALLGGSKMLWLFVPLLFSAEILSTCLRIVTLNLRLFWNIEADHKVIHSFVEMIPFPIPIPAVFYFMGFFVAFMQAFVFTLLTMVYILLATAHEESH